MSPPSQVCRPGRRVPVPGSRATTTAATFEETIAPVILSRNRQAARRGRAAQSLPLEQHLDFRYGIARMDRYAVGGAGLACPAVSPHVSALSLAVARGRRRVGTGGAPDRERHPGGGR